MNNASGPDSLEGEAPICVTCGTQYAPGVRDECPICQDERQYVDPDGQRWTSMGQLQRTHRNSLHAEEQDLIGVGVEPSFGIGQRALLVRTPAGNVLWDCVSLLDDALREAVRRLGGIAAIAVSHPHFFASMAAWSRAFDDAPIHIHADCKAHVHCGDANVRLWDAETQKLPGGLTLIRVGGHFEGSQVLHWPQGADGRGALLTGDMPHVCADRRWVTFMYSYPNFIPLPVRAVTRVVHALRPFAFDRLYGAWSSSVIPEGAKAAVERSAIRYIRALGA